MELSYNDGDNVQLLVREAIVQDFLFTSPTTDREFTCTANTKVLDLFRQHTLEHLQSMGFDYDTSDSTSVGGAVKYSMPGLGTLELIPDDTLDNTIHLNELITN